MWYDGNYLCGHEGRVEIYGPVKDRDRKITWAFSQLCPKCKENEREAAKEKEYQEALSLSKEYELPELLGTEKQVRFATVLRIKLLNYIQSFTERFEKYDKKIQERILDEMEIDERLLLNLYQYVSKKKTSSDWYIENRSQLISDSFFRKLLQSYQKFEDAGEEDLKLIDEESLIIPKEQIYPGQVIIKTTEDAIKAYYPKHDEFMKLVKQLNYIWNGVWTLKITYRQENIIDRMAELANLLLTNGFAVQLYNAEARKKAIEGTFLPACYRWVGAHKSGDSFFITWHSMNDALYQKARKLPSSKWAGGGVVVKIMYYKEVQDFAALEGFKFSPAAKKMIDAYKKQLSKIKPIEAVKPVLPEEEDKLREILLSSNAILEHLKDDDECN